MRNVSSFGRTRALRLAAALALLTMVPLACGDDDGDDGDPTGPAPDQVIFVAMRDDVFSQQVDTVAVGGTVIWSNSGSNPHTSIADANLWDSDTVAPGESFTREFPEAGTFPYYCRPHGAPNGVGMSGTIVVR